MKENFENKKVLVTGGTGSIGSEIVRQLLESNPKQVRVLSRDETKQFEFQQELGKIENIRFLIGDVREKERLRRAMEDIDVVFHAAALKHVPSCEYNPFEAVKTNVYGTQNVIEAALEAGVEKVVTISTDKATNPVNTMGASKLLAERLTSAAHLFRGTKKTLFSTVRFGNVLGSRGSVTELFKTQIEKGGPVTLTNPNMTRFIMSIKQAVDLIFKASDMMQGGEIFILKMPAMKMDDFVHAFIEEAAPKYNKKPADIKIENIGIRAGEKQHEELMTEEEAKNALETQDMFIVSSCITKPHNDLKSEKRTYPNAKPTKVGRYCSKDAKMLDKEELKSIFKKIF